MLREKQRLDELQKIKQQEKLAKAQEIKQSQIEHIRDKKLKEQEAFDIYTKEKQQVNE
jgi:hypothetical protein